MFSKRDDEGRLLKRRFPGITMLGFKLLARMRSLRGGAFDFFGKTEERRTERQLIAEYEKSIEQLLSGMTHGARQSSWPVQRQT